MKKMTKWCSYDDDEDNNNKDEDTNNHQQNHYNTKMSGIRTIVPTEPTTQLKVTTNTSQPPPLTPRQILGASKAHLIEPLGHMGNQKYVPLRSV